MEKKIIKSYASLPWINIGANLVRSDKIEIVNGSIFVRTVSGGEYYLTGAEAKKVIQELGFNDLD